MKICQEFKYKGVSFKVIKEGEKSIMLICRASFYNCLSVEVWQKKQRKESVINGSVIKAGFKKPSNEDYGHCAHQFMLNHFSNESAMMAEANKRMLQYENLERPKKLIKI